MGRINRLHGAEGVRWQIGERDRALGYGLINETEMAWEMAKSR